MGSRAQRLPTQGVAPLGGHRRWYLRGIWLGLACGGIFIVIGASGRLPGLNRRGPMIPGHKALRCSYCHDLPPGSLRQRLQAKVGRWLGTRKNEVLIGAAPVKTRHCLACHRRRNERHPVFRFLEPRFRTVRLALGPQRCTSCHHEHQGRRVGVETSYCRHCHSGTKVPRDPATPSHKELIRAGQWNSCLRCHDYHGNHRFKTPAQLQQAPTQSSVADYFRAGPRLYSSTLRQAAKKTPPSKRP